MVDRAAQPRLDQTVEQRMAMSPVAVGYNGQNVEEQIAGKNRQGRSTASFFLQDLGRHLFRFGMIFLAASNPTSVDHHQPPIAISFLAGKNN